MSVLHLNTKELQGLLFYVVTLGKKEDERGGRCDTYSSGSQGSTIFRVIFRADKPDAHNLSDRELP